MDKHTPERVVITVLGSDRPGIVAAVTRDIASFNCNILDISQTILQGIFTMTMLVELASIDDFGGLKDALEKTGSELGVQVQLQREDVFKFMYRL